MLSSRTLFTGELTLSYVEGPTNGPRLVMLHGLLGRWQDFAGLIPHLTPRWHVYSIGLRGHGVFLEQLEAVIRHMLAFLEEL